MSNESGSNTGIGREAWHEGWTRRGATLYMGHPLCAGCGASLGLTCIAVDPDWVPPPEPKWPFEVADCPLCFLRERTLDDQERVTGMAPRTAELYKQLKIHRELLRHIYEEIFDVQHHAEIGPLARAALGITEAEQP